ncbi:hypothetical protein BFR47_06615 [Oceanisphaera psychrotolerans]|uniref:Uncharacterized protein n=1 Tax=Oceanisphaera psychrotolerans TaxID=1414654 RepID=A0A1J4QBA5_9GAMM|nr:hypothetical protein BFR47_06615 [Oceanisphaera psychrotolerans]
MMHSESLVGMMMVKLGVEQEVHNKGLACVSLKVCAHLSKPGPVCQPRIARNLQRWRWMHTGLNDIPDNALVNYRVNIVFFSKYK